MLDTGEFSWSSEIDDDDIGYIIDINFYSFFICVECFVSWLVMFGIVLSSNFYCFFFISTKGISLSDQVKL